MYTDVMLLYVVCSLTMVNYLSIINLGFSVCCFLFCIIPTCYANGLTLNALNDYLLTYIVELYRI